MISQIMPHEQGSPHDFRNARHKKQSLVDPLKTDRLPPHSMEAEQGCLGCCLLSPNDCMALVIEKIKDSEIFYDLKHRTIFDCLLVMYNDRVPIDLITVQQELKDLCQLEGIGGLSYLASLPDTVPSAANLDYYVQILLEKFTLRKGITAATEFISKAYEHQGEVDEIVETFERDVIQLTGDRSQTSTPPFKELIGQAITYIEGRHQRQGQIGGLSTGFPDLDKLCDGFHAGEFIIIAGRPGSGKTSVAMNIVEHVILELNLPVGVFSMEMTGQSLALRMMSSVARVNTRGIQDGFISERDFARLAVASGRLGKAPLFIDDESSLSIMRFRAKARRMHQQHGIKLLVADYLQLMTSPGRKENRQQEVTEISHGVKALAKELMIPVLGLAQLNRDVEREKGRRPKLSDLRESGSLEADSDLVGLLYKPKREDEDKPEEDAVPTTLIIAKQRSGPCADVALTFIKSLTRFESAAKISGDDYKTPYNDH